MPTVYKKTLKCIGNNDVITRGHFTFTLTCGKGVTELQNLTNLHLLSFAESHEMQQKNFDVSPNAIFFAFEAFQIFFSPRCRILKDCFHNGHT